MTDRINLVAESLLHWQRMQAQALAGDFHEIPSSYHCPLCKEYNRYETPPNEMCLGCPILEYTGLSGCRGTPYEAAQLAFFDLKYRRRHRWKETSDAEIAFLREVMSIEIRQIYTVT